MQSQLRVLASCHWLLVLSCCEIWLQIKPNLDVSLTLDAGESEIMLDIQRNSL